LTPDMLESQSKDSDYGLVSKKTWGKKWLVGLAPSVRWTRPKNSKTTPLVTSPQKNPNPKLNFFSIWTRRHLESEGGLTSSLALAAGKLWPEMARVFKG